MSALPRLEVLVIRARIPSGRLPLTEDQVEPRRQDPVDDPDEERDDEHGDEHDGGVRLQLFAVEPGHLGELDPDFLQELAKPLHPGHPPTPLAFMAGVEGFEPPTPGFGDRCSSRTELHACRPTTAGRRLESPLAANASPCEPYACDTTGRTFETRPGRDAAACSSS